MRLSKERLKKIIICTLAMTVIATAIPFSTVIAKTSKSSRIANSNNHKNIDENTIIDNLRLKWRYDLIGGKNLDVNNPAIANKIKSFVNQTDKLLASMNTDTSNPWLWENLKNFKKDPAKITAMYDNVLSMAMAYNLPNNKYYKNEELKKKIFYALDWLYNNAYNEGIKQYGNWWHWMIGTPAKINNITILMYDELPQDKRVTYMNAIQKFSPSIEPGSKYHTGANLADVCINKLLQGVILKNKHMIEEGSQDIVSVFDYVTSGDGFYEDGSFVQHGVVPYTGSYGNVLIDKVSSIMYLTEGTPWAIKSHKKNNVYRWIFESFDPIIFKGYAMDMVRGRSISRYNSDGYKQTAGIMQGMIKIALNSPEDMSNKIKSLVKEWGEEAKSVIDYGTRFSSINVINEYYKIMNDLSIIPQKQEAKHYALNMMDKTIHEREDYSFAISRSSSRITKYEFMNEENLRPWFQGDGMTYLYNNDLTQFSNDFWPTIDPYRLPGTTVNTMPRKDKVGTGPAITYELGLSNWSGGAKLGTYGVSGMQISNKNDDLKANKSWFMFDNEIVALGSGITSYDNNDIETIVENRKINKSGNNEFIVDGVSKVKNLGDTDKINNAKWAYLQGKNKSENIGYYFPVGENINLIREQRKGNWKEINPPKGDKPAENNYLTMYIDHGKDITDKKYSYVLLPGKSKEEVKSYSEKPNVEIVRNDDIAQGVIHKELNIEAANFWKDGNNTCGAITSSGKASIIIKENKDGVLSISISDPTFEQENLNIEINKPGIQIVSKDEDVSNINLNNNKIKFSVNTNNAKGKSFELKVKVK